ncbi:MAG: transglutaminase domain-containing protein [Candidatus Marinimicrobia bacterium]|nr:transglutaminase domain-containing protein [Candidatus Neomarinimicrobiota bacterium]
MEIKKLFLNYSLIFLLVSSFIITGCNTEVKKPGGTLPNISQIDNAIDRGHFQEAKEMIRKIRCANAEVPDTLEIELDFRLALMKRIKLDFNKTEEEVRQKLDKYYPELTSNQLQQWEKDKVLEMRMINGKKRYFHNSVYNLFLIDDEAKVVKEKIDGKKEDPLKKICLDHTGRILDDFKSTGKNLLVPVTMRINYKLSVDANAVPAGEVIRCWMPYPRTRRERQSNIKLLSTGQDNFVIAPEDQLQRSIYMEKVAKKDQPTVFTYEFKYTSRAEYFDPANLPASGYNPDSKIYEKYTQENPPHIVFSDRIRSLTTKITKDAHTPYEKVKKIYEWIDENIPWASALEYSTFRNIPAYVLDNRHGDCGMQTLLFITMARFAGVPAKWQSGWMLHPGEVNLHDWAEVYYPKIGWVPVDQSFSLQKAKDQQKRYFYTSGIDSYRLIVNDAYSQEFYPQKIHPRSETVDFQRGEVEWRGGNLYFNQWGYNMEVEYLE